MVVIGIDPHKGSHTAVAVDESEHKLDEVRVRADRRQLERLTTWARTFPERSWAIESANGLGALLSQLLVGGGEEVFDVPPTLSARVRVLASGEERPQRRLVHRHRRVALLRLQAVVAKDHVAVLHLLWNRRKNLGSLHTPGHIVLGRQPGSRPRPFSAAPLRHTNRTAGDMATVARYRATRARIPHTRWRATRIRPAFVVPTVADARCPRALRPAPAAGDGPAAPRSGDRRRPAYRHHLGDRSQRAPRAHEHAPTHRRSAHGVVTGAGFRRGPIGRTRRIGGPPLGARTGVLTTSHTTAVQAPRTPATCPPMA
jgi:hypothetical protein